MTKAIQQIVDAYVRLNNRQGLEDPKMHRRRLAVDLKDCATRSGKHYCPPHLNAQLSELDRLRARSSAASLRGAVPMRPKRGDWWTSALMPACRWSTVRTSILAAKPNAFLARPSKAAATRC